MNSSLAADLDRTLSQVDSDTARLLARIVREVMALAQRRASGRADTDSLGYPLGYFESTAGSFASESLEVPEELPFEIREPW